MNKITYYHPPRSNIAIPYSKDNQLVKQWLSFNDLIVQYKYNGTRALCYIFPDGEIQFWNRHNEAIDYQLPLNLQKELLKISNGRNVVFDGELLHFKTKTIKNSYIIYDIFVLDNILLNKSYKQRYSILENLGFNKTTDNILSNSLLLASNVDKNLIDNIFDKAKSLDWLEGVVLKREGPVSNLKPLLKDTVNGSFMARIRKPNKNYLS